MTPVSLFSSIDNLLMRLNRETSKKIAIWGPPCSGKSYIAKKIARQLNISPIVPIIHSDDYLYWTPKSGWCFEEKMVFLQIVEPIFDEKYWIVEGNLGDYISREKILELADKIIILNPSYLKLFYRIITRTLSRNTRFSIGNHTKENAKLSRPFSMKDLWHEIVNMIKTVRRFKQSYIHYLLDVAKKNNNASKVIIVN